MPPVLWYSKNGMKKKIILIVILGVLFILPVADVFAQSNQVIDALLLEERATFQNSVYLILSVAGIIPEEATGEEAVEALKQTDWKIKIKGPDEPIRLGTYSLLLMKAFNIKGGIFYTLFPSPRYASRELGYKGYIKKGVKAGRYLTGRDAIKIMGRVVRAQEQQS